MAVKPVPRPRELAYFNEVLIDANFVFRWEPIPLTTAMIASEMPAAIKPYSIAVAPDSSARNLRTTFMAAPFWMVGEPCIKKSNGALKSWMNLRALIVAGEPQDVECFEFP
jgi:hypothetical protein